MDFTAVCFLYAALRHQIPILPPQKWRIFIYASRLKNKRKQELEKNRCICTLYTTVFALHKKCTSIKPVLPTIKRYYPFFSPIEAKVFTGKVKVYSKLLCALHVANGYGIDIKNVQQKFGFHMCFCCKNLVSLFCLAQSVKENWHNSILT